MRLKQAFRTNSGEVPVWVLAEMLLKQAFRTNSDDVPVWKRVEMRQNLSETEAFAAENERTSATQDGRVKFEVWRFLFNLKHRGVEVANRPVPICTFIAATKASLRGLTS